MQEAADKFVMEAIEVLEAFFRSRYLLYRLSSCLVESLL